MLKQGSLKEEKLSYDKTWWSADGLTGNLPEQEDEGQEERPEVVVLVDGTFTVFFNPNVPKELVQHNKT